MNAAHTRLAVDLGTTWTAAAVTDAQGTRPLHLGDRGAAIPSVVAVDEAGTLVVGATAERILAVNPDRGVREIKRRFGDTTPIVLAGAPHLPDALTAALLAGVAATAEIDPASTTVVLTHPANWGDYKLELLRNVGAQAGFADVEVVSEPAAAALHYASTGRLSVGDAVAVYDFGGGTFDAAVVRLEADGPALLGAPQGIERLGGIDIDQVVFSHVTAALGGSLQALDRNDPDVRRAILRLRSDCTTAKELLSADSEATVAIAAPGLHTQVRMTRGELESALRPRVAETVRSLERAVASAGLQMGDLAGVVLVGGSSRLPIVAEIVAAETGLPTLLDADAKLVVVLGAALPHGATPAASSPAAATAGAAAAVAATQIDTNPEAPASPTAPATPSRQEPTMSDNPTNESATQPTRGSVPPPPPPKKKDEGKINPAVVGGVAAAAAAATAAAVVWGDDLVDAVTGGDDDGADAAGADLGETRAADRIEREAEAAEAAALVEESMDVFDEAVVDAAAAAPSGGPAPSFAPPSAGGSGGSGGSGGNSGGSGRSEGSDRAPSQRQDSVGSDRGTPPPPPPAPAESEAPAAESGTPAADGSLAVDEGTAVGEAPAADAAFEDARATLLERIGTLDLGEGVDPADAAALQAELTGLVERYQPLPGQSTEDALAALRDEYDQRVQDFTQDQKIEALIEEELRDNADDEVSTEPAEEAPLTVDTDGDGIPDMPAPLDPAAEGEPPAAEGETPAAEGETPAAEGEMPAPSGDLPEGWTAVSGIAGWVVLDENGQAVSDQQMIDAGVDPGVYQIPTGEGDGTMADPDDGGEVAADPDDGGEVDGLGRPGLGIGLDDLMPDVDRPVLQIDPTIEVTVPPVGDRPVHLGDGFDDLIAVGTEVVDLGLDDNNPLTQVGDTVNPIDPGFAQAPINETVTEGLDALNDSLGLGGAPSDPGAIVDGFNDGLEQVDDVLGLGGAPSDPGAIVDGFNDGLEQVDDVLGLGGLGDPVGVDFSGVSVGEVVPDLGGIHPDVVIEGVPGLVGQAQDLAGGAVDLIGDAGQLVDDAVDVPFEPAIEEAFEQASDFAGDTADDASEFVNDTVEDVSGTISGIADDIGL